MFDAAPAKVDTPTPSTHNKPGDWRVACTNSGDEVVNDADRVGATVAYGSPNES
jgi:invasion protein IalB